MITQFRIFIVPALLVAILGCAAKGNVGGATWGDKTIPAEYRVLYEELSKKLGQLQAGINSVPGAPKARIRFGVELLVANSNRGEILLTERVFKATVLTLDRLQSMGVQCGLAVIVEMGTLFRQPEFSQLRVDYSQLTLEKFKVQLGQMAQIVATDLKPDYLTILTEPDTQSQNTGLDFSVSNFSDTVAYVVQGLGQYQPCRPNCPDCRRSQ